MVLFFLAFYPPLPPFSSKHFLGLFIRSLSTQLFFLVVLLLLLLSVTAFSYVGILSLLWVQLFYAVFVSHLPPSSFLEGLSSEQFEGLGPFSSGLFFDLPVFRGFVLSSLQGCLDILSFFRVCSKAILCLVILLISAIQRVHFSYSSQGIF